MSRTNAETISDLAALVVTLTRRAEESTDLELRRFYRTRAQKEKEQERLDTLMTRHGMTAAAAPLRLVGAGSSEVPHA
jgi:hypothetical protein